MYVYNAKYAIKNIYFISINWYFSICKAYDSIWFIIHIMVWKVFGCLVYGLKSLLLLTNTVCMKQQWWGGKWSFLSDLYYYMSASKGGANTLVYIKTYKSFVYMYVLDSPWCLCILTKFYIKLELIQNIYWTNQNAFKCRKLKCSSQMCFIIYL